MCGRTLALIYYCCAAGIPKAAAVLHNDRITDNSSEVRPCLFLHPTCLKCSRLSVTSPAKSAPVAQPSRAYWEMCVSVGGWACARGRFMWPGSAIIWNPALVVLDEAIPMQWPKVSMTKYLQVDMVSPAKRKSHHPSFATVHLSTSAFVCVLSLVFI